MNVENFIAMNLHTAGDERKAELRREQTATDFEELFARHLVQEMTKDAFDMTDKSSGAGQSNALYREFITDALAGELAAQRQLGMADMVKEYWARLDQLKEPDNPEENPGPMPLSNERTDDKPPIDL